MSNGYFACYICLLENTLSKPYVRLTNEPPELYRNPYMATRPSIMDHKKEIRTADITTIYQASCHKICNLYLDHL